jgi:hypothetical protein
MKERAMAQREKLSVGPLRAEGQRSTTFLMALITFGLIMAFALGQWSAILNACFGFRLPS